MGKVKWTIDRLDRLREMYESNMPVKEIAKAFSISVRRVYRIAGDYDMYRQPSRLHNFSEEERQYYRHLVRDKKATRDEAIKQVLKERAKK